MKKIILLLALLPTLAFAQAELEPRVNANENSVQAVAIQVDQNTADIATLQNDLATIELTPGPQGEQGIQGAMGLQGPAGADGADLTNEVSILQGEQAVQNDRIDTLEGSSSIGAVQIVSSTGIPFGRLGPATSTFNYVWAISDMGFMFPVRTNSKPTDVRPPIGFQVPFFVWFSGSSCNGQAYIEWIPYAEFGMIVNTWHTKSPRLYYSAKGVTAVNPTVQSYIRTSNGQCTFFPNTIPLAYAVYPNNESITGVSDISPPTPYHLQ